MGETCQICGLELASVETRNLLHAGELVRYGEYRGKCVKDVSCIQRGYERSQEALVAANARAEKAVAEIVNEQRRFGEMQREAWKLEEALAAARREIEDSRRVIFMLVTQSGGEVVIGRNVILRVDELRATIETTRDPGGDLRIRATLAAPADGESKP